MKIDRILINHKREESLSSIFLVILYFVVFSVVYFIWWEDKISDAAEFSRIFGHNRHFLYIPLAFIIWVVGIVLATRFIIKFKGHFEVVQNENFLIINYRIGILKISKKYDIDLIQKLRVIDKGYKEFQVAFNYGTNENYIGIGRGYPEETAQGIFNSLNLILNKIKNAP